MNTSISNISCCETYIIVKKVEEYYNNFKIKEYREEQLSKILDDKNNNTKNVKL